MLKGSERTLARTPFREVPEREPLTFKITVHQLVLDSEVFLKAFQYGFATTERNL